MKNFPSADPIAGHRNHRGIIDDPLAQQLRTQAAEAADRHWHTLQAVAWEETATQLREHIVAQTGVAFYPQLPLLLKETKRIPLQGLTVAAIRYQTLPDVFATASLYIPSGEGPHPGIVLTHGHWEGARNSELFQEVAQYIARHGYVCLVPDAWGAGERSTVAGVEEYHGSNLGASLLNIGKTLLGMQVTENIRAVDLLCTLPYVDHDRIGATGASGGGNQAMWLAALDTRVRAVVPVVSVGTFQSYIMNSNCVCELLPGGLTFTEEAGVLGLIAPRALRIINAAEEANPSFMPAEMQRSYRYAQPIFEQLDVGNHIDHQVIAGTHGYNVAMQASMIAWFNRHLKQQPASKPPLPVSAAEIRSAGELATYSPGAREAAVQTTATFCTGEGHRIREALMQVSSIEPEKKKHRLRQLLGLQEAQLRQVNPQLVTDGWQAVQLTTASGNVLPIWLKQPANPAAGIAVLVHGQGRDRLPASAVSDITAEGKGILTLDLWGTGSHGSVTATQIDGKLSPHHTLSRSMLWLGQTMMGQWAGELCLAMQWVQSQYPEAAIQLTGFREAGLAALYAAPFTPIPSKITVVDTPVSYLFDAAEGIDHYNMSVHVPGILPWGDIGMLAALANGPITFRNPCTLSGRPLDATALRAHWGFFKTMQRIADRQVDVRFE